MSIEIKKNADGMPLIILELGKNIPLKNIPIESAEAHLLLMILDKLEGIRCGIIDVETIIKEVK